LILEYFPKIGRFSIGIWWFEGFDDSRDLKDLMDLKDLIIQEI